MPRDRNTALRPVVPEDEPFLLELYASTREQELALTPWNEDQRRAFVEMQFAAQSAYYREQYPDGEHLVILSGDLPVGRLYVARRKDEIRILDITIVPVHRGGGVGTLLLREIMAEAARSQKPVRIYVESLNRSIGLFERLGFSRVGDHGISWLMEWRQG